MSLHSLTLADIWTRWEAAMDEDPGPWQAIVDFAVHVGDIAEALDDSGSREFERLLPVYGWLDESRRHLRASDT